MLFDTSDTISRPPPPSFSLLFGGLKFFPPRGFVASVGHLKEKNISLEWGGCLLRKKPGTSTPSFRDFQRNHPTV